MNGNRMKYLACTGTRKSNDSQYSFSNKIVKKKKLKKEDDNSEINYKNDIDLAIALSLSEQLQLSKNETDKLMNSDICEKIFDEEELTTIDEFDNLVKASIMSFGGKTILPNKGGGNCLFHTFSTHLNIDHKELRNDATQYIRLNWNKFKNFALKPDTLEPYKSKDDYLNYMSQEGKWGDHLSLLALCELYQINAILIVTKGKELSDPIKINVGSTRTVLIKFTSEFHYEAIV